MNFIFFKFLSFKKTGIIMEILKTKNTLNSQEIMVCELLRKNYELEKIAEIMQVSLHTVKSHISKIKRMNLN